MLVLGVDDAGRGPLIGPMILAGVLIDKESESDLKKIGAKDSKLLVHSERIRLAKEIKTKAINFKIVHASPQEIDEAVFSGKNLNTLEAQKIAEVINLLNDGKKEIKVLVDCPSVNITKWRETLITYIKKPGNLNVICEHKADYNHPVVSAASIIAKVEREEQVTKIKKEFISHGDVGSGYPSDPITKEFLKKHGKALENSGIFRKSWKTWQELFPSVIKKGQKTLKDF